MKSLKELKELNDDSNEIFCPNMWETYYAKRGEDLEDVCLHDILRYWVRKLKGKDDKEKKDGDDDDDDDDEVEEKKSKRRRGRPPNESVMSTDNTFMFVKRSKPVVVKSRNIVLTPERSEEYYQLLLQLYVPYRLEDELKRNKATFEEAFEEWSRDENVGPRLRRMHELKEEMRTVERKKKALEEQAAELDMQQEREDLEIAFDQVEVGAMDEGDVSAALKSIENYGTEEGLAQRVSELNEKQKKVYDKVMATMQHEMDHVKRRCKCKKEQLLLFVSGGAGVGKSKVIETITEGIEVMEKREKSNECGVALAAPTGMAGKNIGGVTLHRLFKLLPNRTRKTKWTYSKLNANMSKAMYEEMKTKKLLVVDEVSMVSKKK